MKKGYILLLILLFFYGTGCIGEVNKSKYKTETIVEENSATEYVIVTKLLPEVEEWTHIVIIGCDIKNYGEYPMITDKNEMEKFFSLLETDKLKESDGNPLDNPWGEFKIRTETQEIGIQFFANSQIAIDGILYTGTLDYIKEISDIVKNIPGFGEKESND